MKFLDNPPHPHGVQAELTAFLDAHRRKQQQTALPIADKRPVGGPVTQKVRELFKDAASPWHWLTGRSSASEGAATFEEGNVDRYHAGLTTADQRFPGFVTMYDKAHYANHRTFTSPDGHQGYALLDHGDGRKEIAGLYNNDPENRGAGDHALRHAVAQGGNYLEAFDRDKSKFSLPQHYHRSIGALPTRYHTWDEQYAHPNWRHDRYGRPGLVEMHVPEDKRTPDPVEFEQHLADAKGKTATYADGSTGEENTEAWHDHEQEINRAHTKS